MTTENNVKHFLFSEAAAKIVGFKLGLKKDGSIITYTAFYDEHNLTDYRWKDTVVAHVGEYEDFVAVKTYDAQKGTWSLIRNKTGEPDPFESNILDVTKRIQYFKILFNLIDEKSIKCKIKP